MSTMTELDWSDARGQELEGFPLGVSDPGIRPAFTTFHVISLEEDRKRSNRTKPAAMWDGPPSKRFRISTKRADTPPKHTGLVQI